MSTRETRNLAILLTDIKGFTDKTSRKTRDAVIAMLESHKEIVLPILEARGGRLIKTIGDAFLMVFDSPTDAVLAGVEVQDALREFNADREGDDRIDIRIAINSGEVTLTDGDIFGDPVNITARIESVAEAGEVFFTEAVYLAMNKKEVPSSEIGLLQLKGIPEKIRAYKVVRETPIQERAGPATRTGLWGLLRKRNAPASPAKARLLKDAALAPLPRRAAALLFDLLICWVLVSSLTASESTQFRFRKKPVPPRFGAEMNEAGRRLAAQDADKIEAALRALPTTPYTHEGALAPVAEVLERMSKAAGVRVALDPAVDGTVLPDFSGIPLRRAFEIVLHRKELAAQLLENGTIRVRRAVWSGDETSPAGNLSLGVPGVVSMSVETKAGPSEIVSTSPKGVATRRRTSTRSRTVRIGGEAEEAVNEEPLFQGDGLTVSKATRKQSRTGTLLWVLYSVLFLSLWSATPGKKILGLKVVRAASGEDLDWKTALTRSLLFLVSVAPALLGLAWALFSAKRQGWHDSLAETLVVRAPRA